MSVVNAWQGAASSSGFRVRAKVTGSSVRLLVSTHPDVSDPVAFGPVLPTADGIATLDATGLNPGNRYWWAVEDDGVQDTQFPGTLTTFPAPGQRATFTFAAASCAGANPETPGVGDVLAADRLSNHEVFDTIRARGVAEGWLFFAQLGDIQYYDLNDEEETHGITGGGSIQNYRRCYDDVLLQPNQHALYRELPLVYSAGAGGHDYGQPIHLARTLPGRNNQIQAWRERVPDYPTANPAITAGTYRSFRVDRVLFVVTDENADRDPDGTPNGPNKTKLGAEQKAWLRQTLETTDAEVFVWLSGAQWERGGSANWGRYPDERDELVGMFGELGWLDRMVFVTGDRHALEFVQGADNPWGGFPIWHFASLDCPPSEPPGPGAIGLPGNNQYGNVQVTDTGDEITLTGTGWVGSMFWDSDTLTVDLSSPPPPVPTPEPEQQVAQAKLKAAMSWLACDLSTGKVIGSLPNLQVSEVSRVIGDYTSSSVQLPIPAVGGRGLKPSERAALAMARTKPGRTMLVAVVNNIPMWAGIPLSDSWGTPATTPLGYASVDTYLRHRYVRDHDWDLQDTGSVIAAQLLTDANAPIDGHGGGIGLVIDAQPTGRLESRKYRFYEHRSVYDALTKLMAAGGLEWTIDIDWAPGQVGQFVSLIARVRPRIGVAAASGPSAVFTANVFSSTGAASASYALDGDYSDGNFANVVYAYSSGQGQDQPVSDPAIDTAALDAGAPIWEKHFQPEQSISSIELLGAHAGAELDRVRRGHSALNVEAVWNAYPRYGIDWQLGDDVGVKLYGHAHPNGLTGVRRAVGFRLQPSAGTIVPILQEDVV